MAHSDRLEATLTGTAVTRRCLADALLTEFLTRAGNREPEAAE